jgi:hypothetical protein
MTRAPEKAALARAEDSLPEAADQRSPESGFAYLLAMLFVVVLILSSSIAIERGLAQARRQREALTIWRGEQYVRAIRLYYKKTQHYPQNIEELQKGAVNIHFLRPAAYKNPMNKQDGSWRLIYINGAGQILGSVRYANLQQMALIVLNNGQMPNLTPGQPGAPGVPGLPGAAAGTPGAAGSAGATPSTPPPAPPGNPNGDGTDTPQPTDPNTGDQQPAPADPQAPLPTTQPPPGQVNLTDQSGQGVNPMLLMKPTGPLTGPVVGGFLTGVALAQDKPSQKVYEGGKKYIQWEFIWNPMVDQARAIQSGGNGGATGSLGGANGVPGGAPGAGGGLNGGGLFPTTGNQPPAQPPAQPQQPQIPQ